MFPFLPGDYPEWMATVSPQECEYHIRSGYARDDDCGHFVAGITILCVHKETGNEYSHDLVSNHGFETLDEATKFADAWAQTIIGLLAAFGFINNVAGPFNFN